MKPGFALLATTLWLFGCGDPAEEPGPGGFAPLATPWRRLDPTPSAGTWSRVDGALLVVAPPAATLDAALAADDGELLLEYRWREDAGPKRARLRFGTLDLVLDPGRSGDLQRRGGSDAAPAQATAAPADEGTVPRTHELIEASLGSWNRLRLRWSRERVLVRLNGLRVNASDRDAAAADSIALQVSSGEFELRRLAAR